MEADETARRIVDLAADHQGEDILLLDLRDKVDYTDYFVICSGINDRHLRALAEAIDEGMNHSEAKLLRTEGTPESGWVLMDYSDVVVHLFSEESRAPVQFGAAMAGSYPRGQASIIQGSTDRW